jgi:hypothetical protein
MQGGGDAGHHTSVRTPNGIVLQLGGLIEGQRELAGA